jgi:LPXTG-motif cell wall-anchored protein
VTPPAGDTTAAPARELPKTASELPLVGLVGLLALSAAITVRAFRRGTA